MKSIRIFALFAILALSAHLTVADDCDDAECISTIAVTQRFNTADCTGNASLSMFYNYTKPCETIERAVFNQSSLARCSSEALSIAITGGSTTCTTRAQTYTTTTGIGFCTQLGDSRSEIIWCNKASISTNFKPLKSATNESVIMDISESCNMTTGCSDATGSLRAYSAAGCRAANLTEVFPPSMIDSYHLELDTCYTTNSTRAYDRRNVMATCSNGQYKIRYSTGGCGSSSNTLSVHSYPTDTCIQYDLDAWISISCRSAASTLVASAPLVFILFVLFLFI